MEFTFDTGSGRRWSDLLGQAYNVGALVLAPHADDGGSPLIL